MLVPLLSIKVEEPYGLLVKENLAAWGKDLKHQKSATPIRETANCDLLTIHGNRPSYSASRQRAVRDDDPGV